MYSYNKRKTVESYTVSKQLIKDIESYLNENVVEIINPSSSNKNMIITQSVTLYDTHADEEYTSIDHYLDTQFRNDIERIEINFSLKFSNSDERLSIKLRLGQSKAETDLTTNLFFKNSYELVRSIEEGLFRVLETHKNTNWIFYPAEILAITLFIGMIIAGGVALDKETHQKTAFLLGTTFWIISFYLFIIKHFKGYCAFDTNRQKELNKWFNWLIMGAAGFLLFSTIFTSVRKGLFGF